MAPSIIPPRNPITSRPGTASNALIPASSPASSPATFPAVFSAVFSATCFANPLLVCSSTSFAPASPFPGISKASPSGKVPSKVVVFKVPDGSSTGSSVTA